MQLAWCDLRGISDLFTGFGDTAKAMLMWLALAESGKIWDAFIQSTVDNAGGDTPATLSTLEAGAKKCLFGAAKKRNNARYI